MKKLVLLFTAVLFTAISANVFAQGSTGTTPALGATHNYFVTDNSNTMLWTITKADFSVISDAGTITTPGAASTDIEWHDTVTVGDWYYVHILETEENGCSNEKVLPVQITASPFYLTIAVANATQCYAGAVSASIDSGDPSIINYDHGNAELVFTVTPSGLSANYTGYTFDLTDIDYGTYTGLTENITFSSNVTSSTGGAIVVNDNLAVTITYMVDNTNVFTNADTGAVSNYTATSTISNGETSNGVSDNGTGNNEKDIAVSRPNTSGIGTN